MHQLAVHTIGGVVVQGELLMLIVPDGDSLVIEAKVVPQDIDHVHVGQSAYIRFPAFSQRTTPEFRANVTHVAADLTRDPQAGSAWFVVRIALFETEWKQLGNLKLKPGMPVEVQIRTTERTVVSYFLKPLMDQVSRAFKKS